MSPGSATPEAVCDVVRLLRPLVLQLARALEGPLKGQGITPGARAAMEILAAAGPQTVPDIARQWTLGRQNVQRIVDALIERAWVQRVQNPGHRRSALLSLTPEGATRFRELRRHEQEVIAQLTPGLGQSDVEACRRVLLHLHAGFRFPAGKRAAP